MNKFIMLAVLVASVSCEPPVSGGYGGGGGRGGGGGGDEGPTNEGQAPGAIVDQALLDRISDILSQQSQQGGGGGSSGGGYGAPAQQPSSGYGAPAPQPNSGYGAPQQGGGGKIELGKVTQGNLVANFVEQGQQQQQGYSGGGGGGGSSSSGYGR